jgi:hypothetical protein
MIKLERPTVIVFCNVASPLPGQSSPDYTNVQLRRQEELTRAIQQRLGPPTMN